MQSAQPKTAPAHRRLYRFGAFELRCPTGELTRAGARIDLQFQPQRVLEMLLENAGELVSREALRNELWREGTFVDFEIGLNTAMHKVRNALRDSASKPVYIETLARRGYRFIAPVAVFELDRDRMPSLLYPATTWLQALPAKEASAADAANDW
jgi:DNA-binding winged helix-turn-helix (wHTH) protein